jgi:hypothetical protein
LQPSEVTAVLVTRGTSDISDVLESLEDFGQVVVWDNSKRPDDRKVYGRYFAMAEARFPVIYTQDDDCIVDAAALVAQYEAGVIVANSDPKHREVNAPLYRNGISLIGWGAIFDRELAGVFSRYLAQFAFDDLLLRECDRVFTGLNRLKHVEVPFRNLDRASAPDRMWRESRHIEDLGKICERVVAVQGLAA